MFALSDLALDGFGCVSKNIPLAPAAIPAFAIVSINCGLPPVTPEI